MVISIRWERLGLDFSHGWLVHLAGFCLHLTPKSSIPLVQPRVAAAAIMFAQNNILHLTVTPHCPLSLD